MRRPRWIGALVLALAIAAIFAGLGQWQLERAVTSNDPANVTSEVSSSLTKIATPQRPVLGTQVGQIVSVSGVFESADFGILANRLNDGNAGFWVIGHLSVAAPGDPALAVALGWSPTRDAALTIRDRLAAAAQETVSVEGRYVDPEAPNVDDAQVGRDGRHDMTAMSTAALAGVWTALTSSTAIYGGYVVDSTPPEGLSAIFAPSPDRSSQLNWLNIFYAAEWIIFAGFAVFLWYRLAKDAWERELEEFAEAAVEARDGAGDNPRPIE